MIHFGPWRSFSLKSSEPISFIDLAARQHVVAGRHVERADGGARLLFIGQLRIFVLVPERRHVNDGTGDEAEDGA